MKIMIAAVAVLFASAAMAQDRGFYIGAGGGASEFETKVFDIELPSLPPQMASSTVKDSDTGFKVYAGYRFNRNFGLEFAYHDLGTHVETIQPLNVKSTWKASSVDASLVGIIPLSDGRFDLFGRIGASFMDLSASTEKLPSQSIDPNFGVEPSSSGEGFTWAIGGQLNLLESRKLHIRAEYAGFEISEIDRSSYAGLSIGYIF